MRMTRSSLFFGTLMLAAAAIGASGAEPAVKGGAPEAGERVGVDLAFPGGTIGEYFETLRKAAGDINLIIMEPAVAAIRFPAVRLRSASLGSAVKIVNGRYDIENGNEYEVHVQALGSDSPGQKDVFQIFGERIVRVRVEVKIWTLTDLLEGGFKAEDVLSAVEMAVNMVDVGDPAKVRFHEGTRLLVLSGNGNQCAVVNDVIDGLREGISRREALRQAELERNGGPNPSNAVPAPKRAGGGDKREGAGSEK